ncbi:MAG TPA: hypothetical protein VFG42_07695 [Baekduia sp.]|uniref:hypothetical protein n=1 Tax=Baekduia sp. TaxID=2600305 RepID=UPI002D76BBF0|nr:hypothetical protein [Baekduia sp.]HET6506656.1 hypothetical protein [Baekduia sp.]
MPASPPVPRRLLTALRWPPGIALTAWAYVWRITVLHRREQDGTLSRDGPPPWPPGTDLTGVQQPADGTGALLHRTYLSRIRESELDAAELMARVRADPDVVAPGALARFHKAAGAEGRMAAGDEFLIRMPGPWDGPVRCVHVDERSFRFATLSGHLEAGQIEWGAADLGPPGALAFRIESWAAPGDRLSNLLHHHLRMAKEVQLHMWTSVHERVAKLCGGRLDGGIDIETRIVER